MGNGSFDEGASAGESEAKGSNGAEGADLAALEGASVE